MNLKCKLGLHDWDIWQDCITNRYVSSKKKYEYRICMRCYEQQQRLMPPLIERIRLLLNTKDLLRIQCGTRDLKKIYGVLAYNKAILELAQGKFYIPHKKPNEEINQELIRYYLCKS